MLSGFPSSIVSAEAEYLYAHMCEGLFQRLRIDKALLQFPST